VETQKVDRRQRLTAVTLMIFGLGFLAWGLFARFYYYTYNIVGLPGWEAAFYPYREQAFPLVVLGLLILMAGIIMGVWAWGRRA